MMYTMIPYRSHRAPAHHRMPSLFDDRFFRSFFDMNDWMGNMGFRVDIHEEKDHYLLEAELPGAAEDQISLTVDDNALTIAADMASSRKEERAYYSERRIGHVSRTFRLEGVEESQITAEYKNGILSVTLPKKQPVQENQERRIPIRIASASESGEA